MSGMEPMLIGAAAGAALNRKNPLLGAFMGGAGGALMPAFGGVTAGTTAATEGALTGAGASTAANTAFMAPAGVNPGTLMGASQGAGYTAATVPSTIFSTPSAINTAMTPAIERSLSYGMPGVEFGQGGAPTMMERLGAAGQFAQQNPILTQMAFQTGKDLLSHQQPMLPPAGLMRGNQMQVQGPQYQVGVPKVSLI